MKQERIQTFHYNATNIDIGHAINSNLFKLVNNYYFETLKVQQQCFNFEHNKSETVIVEIVLELMIKNIKQLL